MRRLVVVMAAAVALAACGQPAGHVVARLSPPAVTTTSPVPPSVVPGPGGTSVPVFQRPYSYGTPQALVPPVADGMVPVLRRIETDKPYVFVTIDDGAVRHPAALELMRKSGVEPTLFLNTKHVRGNADYFRSLQDQAGAKAHSHTANHPNLLGKSYDFQKQEICGNAAYIEGELGARPTLFRPPFGNYDATTRRAAADCGFTALVLWTAAVNDGVVQFQAGDHLNRGDIVLMHFRHTFVEDFLAFLNRARQDGLTPVVLTDFLSSSPPPA